MKGNPRSKSQKNSYLFEKIKDSIKEISLLETRALRDKNSFVRHLRACGLKRNMRVLDVGSGTGHRAKILARFVRNGEVVGIDRSEKLLSEAQLNLKLKNLIFKKIDFQSFSQLSGIGKFDFVYVRLVIQHLKDPESVLLNLKRIMKPGGIIFLEDTDRDWVSLVPDVVGWEDLYKKVKNGQEKRGRPSFRP